jgi:hypothetical protein
MSYRTETLRAKGKGELGGRHKWLQGQAHRGNLVLRDRARMHRAAPEDLGGVARARSPREREELRNVVSRHAGEPACRGRAGVLPRGKRLEDREGKLAT